jgi:hypothetical protein
MLIGVFRMLTGVGCEHLPELKKLALSSDASLLHDVPDDLGRIAKRLVKNWWTHHGLPYCLQKIKEENQVSFTTKYFDEGSVLLSNNLFLRSRRLMQILNVILQTEVMVEPLVMARQRCLPQKLSLLL